MRRIDFYADHLAKQGAASVVLATDAPVEFHFPDGSVRKSSTPLNGKQIVQLIQEAAPKDLMPSLKSTHRGEFTTESSQGTTLAVTIDTTSSGQWRVRLHAVASKPASPKAEAPSPPAPPPAPAAPQAAAQPPAQEAPAPREPKPQPMRAPSAGEPRLNQYLRKLIELGASDLHMSSLTAPLLRLHGEIQPVQRGHAALDPQELHAWMRELATEDAWATFERDNDADFAHEIEGAGRFRMNYFMDRKGPGLVARQIPFDILSAKQLGLPEKVLDLCWLSKGLVLVTGPTGSGKSTTLAALIDYINENRTDHIITIEDPIEFVHPNKRCLVNQREVGVHTDSFKKALRAALREDPDIVLVGEMRDLETISIAVETAETGHLVFGTLHTTTAPSTVDRIIDQFPSTEQGQIRTMLSESLRGVIAQTLCKKRGGGRIAAYEVLFGNSAVANLIREGKTFQLKSVMQTGRSQGMQTLNENLLELVKAGKVEAKEAYIKAVDKQSLKEQFQKLNIKLDLSNAEVAA